MLRTFIIGLTGAVILSAGILMLLEDTFEGYSSIPWMYPIAIVIIAMILFFVSWGMRKKAGYLAAGSVILVTVFAEIIAEVVKHDLHPAIVLAVMLFFVAAILFAQGGTSTQKG